MPRKIVFLVMMLTANFCLSFITPTSAQDQNEAILFLSDRDGSWKLYTMLSDGSNVMPFINLAVLDSYTIGTVELSPDQSKVAFEATTDGFKYDIFWLDLATSIITPITQNSHKENGRIRWSPDGSLIGYLSNGTNGEFGEMNTYSPSTGEYQLVTTNFIDENPDGTFNLAGAIRSFDWSPDSQQLVLYIYTSDPRNVLVVINIDGTEAHVVTPENHEIVWPVWVRDPNIIYGDCDREEHSNICKLNLETLELQNILAVTDTLIEDEEAEAYIDTMSISANSEIIFRVVDSNRIYLYANGTLTKSDDAVLKSDDRILGWIEIQ